MATLKELWDQAGRKPVRVRKAGFISNWFEIHAVGDDGSAAGLTSFGTADAWHKDNTHHWELYNEPKRKRVMYQAVLKSRSGHLPTFVSDKLYNSLEDARFNCGDLFTVIGLGPPIEVEE